MEGAEKVEAEVLAVVLVGEASATELAQDQAAELARGPEMGLVRGPAEEPAKGRVFPLRLFSKQKKRRRR